MEPKHFESSFILSCGSRIICPQALLKANRDSKEIDVPVISVKGKAVPVTGPMWPRGFQEV